MKLRYRILNVKEKSTTLTLKQTKMWRNFVRSMFDGYVMKIQLDIHGNHELLFTKGKRLSAIEIDEISFLMQPSRLNSCASCITMWKSHALNLLKLIVQSFKLFLAQILLHLNRSCINLRFYSYLHTTFHNWNTMAYITELKQILVYETQRGCNFPLSVIT